MARAPAVQEIEALPEADRLEGFPHPRETQHLFGHETTERQLADAVAGGRLHHAWLLTGPAGVGKATLAYRLAVHLLADPMERDPFGGTLAIDGATTAARQVKALSHPGLLVLRRPYDTKTKKHTKFIPVDEVRKLRAFLAHTADEGRWRVVIVDAVDELNVSAANALLKSLEEPPPRTVFLLVCSEPGRLLPTIRSRCRLLALEALPPDPLLKAVRQALADAERPEPDASTAEALLRTAEGSVRRYLALATGDGLKLSMKVDTILARLPRVDWQEAHQLADEVSSAAAEQRFEQLIELLLDRLARIVKAGAGAAGQPQDAEIARRIAGGAGPAGLAALWQGIVDDKADLDALNLDRKTFLLSILSRLESASKPAGAGGRA